MGLAGQHSDHPYAFFCHAGVKTVIPATASDAYGLMVTAIRDDDPVIVFAPAAALALREELPEPPCAVPLGQARVHREGTDVTVVAVGHLFHLAVDVANELADQVSVEVFDPRTVHPFDWAGLRASLAKTRRLVVVDDTNRTCGLAAEIVATAAEEIALDARPRRVTRADATIPFAVALEEALLPSRDQVAAAILAVTSNATRPSKEPR
jgi:acetoin:2,6-dichlorophenolindophenol oxidoreductase subunit beta